jgi:lipopolysaccharide transport system ATP-binding protein
MSDAAVVFDAVWKKFRRGERHDSLRDLIPSMARRVMGRSSDTELGNDAEFWAIKDVSFEVRAGEALGIIGSNGAGKSTTLKLLTRILRPTRGACQLHGRVGALIEVAAGFHPDLTGRENVFLQGAIMGMKRAEIATRLDEIVEFSGTAAFIDTPVKRYSSGMNARLGFSIAAHLNPEVLIIDEVLSVGDVAFQQKCTDRMTEFLDQGVAVVFVSHNLLAVSQLCKHALLLDRGASLASGPAAEVIARYGETQLSDPKAAATHSDVDIRVRLIDRPQVGSSIAAGDRIVVHVDVQFNRAVEDAAVGVVIWDLARNLYVYGATSTAVGLPPLMGVAGDMASFEFDLTANLARGTYVLEVNVFDEIQHRTFGIVRPAAQFTVAERVSYSGVANLFLNGRVLASRRLGEYQCS